VSNQDCCFKQLCNKVSNSFCVGEQEVHSRNKVSAKPSPLFCINQ